MSLTVSNAAVVLDHRDGHPRAPGYTRVKRGSIWRAFAGLSGGIEAARNAFASRHNSVTCTYTF